MLFRHLDKLPDPNTISSPIVIRDIDAKMNRFQKGCSRHVEALIMFGIVTIMLTLVSYPKPVYSQNLDTILQITGVDVSQFPNVSVSIYGENLENELAEVPITLKQDGVEQAIAGSEMQIVGSQIAFIIATDQIPPTNTMPGRLSLTAGEALRKLVKDQIFSVDNDWMMSIATDVNGKPAALQSWTKDFQGVADSIYTFRPITTTTLVDLTYFALQQFYDASLPSNQQKNLVIFSDGDKYESVLTIDDVVNTALAKNIRIYSVTFNDISAEKTRNVRRLSLLTHGQPFAFSDDKSIILLWQLIASGRVQRILTYRSSVAQPQEVNIFAEAMNDRMLGAVTNVPAINIYPIRSYIVQPADRAVIDREAPSWDTPLEEIPFTPTEIVLEFDFGKYPRVIKKLEVTIGGVIRNIEQPPFDRFWLSMRHFDSGTYPIRLRIFDELGLVSEAQPFSINVNVKRPATPTPSILDIIPQPTSDASTSSRSTSESSKVLNIVSIILGVMALMISSYVLVKGRILKEPVLRRPPLGGTDSIGRSNSHAKDRAMTDINDRTNLLGKQ